MQTLEIVAGGGLVKNSKNELLMIFRRGFWDLPKGKQDDDETIEICALREVEEETGLQNVQIECFFASTKHAYFDERFSKKNIVKTTYWFCMSVQSSPVLTPQTDEDIEIAAWCTKEKVKENMKNTYPNIQEILLQYLATTS